MSEAVPSTPEDPVMAAISPMKAMNDHAQVPHEEADSRDDLLGGHNEQSYSAPSAPIVTPPVKNDSETQAAQQEDAARAQAIRPLGI